MKPSLSFDALTLHAVVDELRAGFSGARIQRVGLIDEWTLTLELYNRGERASLLISADPHAARVVVTRERPERDAERVTPFLLLLRKYVRDGRLDSLSQPPLERVLELRVSKRDDEGSSSEVGLIIEVMGRRSNAVLVSEDGTIMDALRRASAEKNPIRPILPHRRYEQPPAQDRRLPFAMDTWEQLTRLAAIKPDGQLAELLGGELAGFSRLVAREVAFRATGDVATPVSRVDWSRVLDTVIDLLGPIRGEGSWTPSIARFEGHIVAFAAYRLHHLEGQCDVQDIASISEAVEQAYAGRAEAEQHAGLPETANQMVRPMVEAIATRRKSVERRRNALARSLEAAGDPEPLRQIGQTILAYAYQIQPGQERLTVDGLDIRLDPRETPSENAQHYFAQYKRARDASRRVPDLIAVAERELSYLAEMDTLVRIADDPSRVRALREELRVAGIVKDRAPQAPRKIGKYSKKAPAQANDGPSPIRVPLPDGFVAWVGTSAKGNEHVTFDVAGQDDVWLHARQRPGSHVIVRTSGQKVPERVLQRAAELAAFYSQGRTDSRVAVDWTPRKFVRRIRGGPPGLVSYINEQTVDVPPRGPS
jgi:predicted ribosome quality control (RQC) complex YloA/Tae2 family protein